MKTRKEREVKYIKAIELDTIYSKYLGNSPEAEVYEDTFDPEDDCYYETAQTVMQKDGNTKIEINSESFLLCYPIPVIELQEMIDEAKMQNATHVYIVTNEDHQEIEFHPFIYQKATEEESKIFTESAKSQDQSYLRLLINSRTQDLEELKQKLEDLQKNGQNV